MPKQTAPTADARSHALLLDASTPGVENKSLAEWLKHDGFLSRFYFARVLAKLRPGAMGVVLVPHSLQASVGMSVRLAGFELRDVLAVCSDNSLAGLVVQKELDGTFAKNVLAHGCGALNIQAARVARVEGDGRWPANLILGTTQATALDERTGGASRFFKSAHSHDELLTYLARLLSLPGEPRLLISEHSTEAKQTVVDAALDAGWQSFEVSA